MENVCGTPWKNVKSRRKETHVEIASCPRVFGPEFWIQRRAMQLQTRKYVLQPVLGVPMCINRVQRQGQGCRTYWASGTHSVY